MFISDAFAQSAAPVGAGASALGTIIQLVFIILIFYLLLIRPQQKRIKEHQAHLNAIIKGTKIIVSGIVGTVKNVKDNELTVEIANGVEIKVLREYVSQVCFPETKNDKNKK